MTALYTPWGEQLDRTCPLPEYPRPQLRRDSYLCLNGLWDYTVEDGDEYSRRRSGKILVPFSPESLLSGCDFRLQSGETLWYERTFTLPEGFRRDRVLLHFGAVDQCCRVLVNDRPVGGHEGGYLPFTLDITGALVPGENRLTVAVTDDPEGGVHAFGKQRTDRGGIWYTAQSGIWQTVWLESVPEAYIEKLNIENHGASVTISTVPPLEGTVSVEQLGQFPLENGRVTIAPEYPRFWCPDDPYLYRFTLETAQDRVESYFAIRSLEIKKVGEYPRLCLNGKPWFFHGLLDQGYWPEGLLTAPAPESYADDILAMKNLGFNTLRKHIKVEPEEFYYQCDRLGMIVWQDMVNNGSYRYFRDTVLPTVGIQKRNDRRLHRDERSRNAFRQGAADAVNQLKNHPCICYWTIFNEGWGQFDSDRVCRWFRTLDATRFIDTTSGWFRGENTDVDSRHQYFGKLRLKGDGLRPLVLSEFGGKTWRVEGHIFNPDKTYGYGACPTKEALNEAVAALYRESILPAVEKGLCAAIYTQVSDVEDEVNGLMTYDRRVVKPDGDTMLPIAQALRDAMEKTVASFEKMG